MLQEAGYYSTNYGLNWVEEKLGAAFHRCPRLEVVLLPAPAFDSEFVKMIHDDDALGLLEKDFGVVIVPVTAAEADAFHPLIAATTTWARAEEARAHVVRDHWHNVSPTYPFYAAVRKQRDFSWMQFCAACMAGAASSASSSSAAAAAGDGGGGGGGGAAAAAAAGDAGGGGGGGGGSSDV